MATFKVGGGRWKIVERRHQSFYDTVDTGFTGFEHTLPWLSESLRLSRAHTEEELIRNRIADWRSWIQSVKWNLTGRAVVDAARAAFQAGDWRAAVVAVCGDHSTAVIEALEKRGAS